MKELIERLSCVLVGGNVAVALLGEQQMAGLALGEVFATSDFPAGVVNLLSGQADELLPHLARHLDVNAIVVAPGAARTLAETLGSESVKRVSSPRTKSLEGILDCMERKTVWHPIGV